MKKTDTKNLYEAFNQAFSGNSVSFKLTMEQFEKRILDKIHIQNNVSGILLDDSQRIIGFALHTISNIEGIQIAYNGGTGVIPSYRGKRVAGKLLGNTLRLLKERNVNKVLLEVITTNKPAIQLYESFGFSFKRQLKCFKLIEEIKSIENKRIKIKESSELKSTYESFWSYPTTFLDSSEHLKHNIANENILEAHLNGQLVGYIIFQPLIGRVSQLAVDRSFRNQGVAKSLISYAQQLCSQNHMTIMNVPEEQESSIVAIQKMGFRNEVDQYEMELII